MRRPTKSAVLSCLVMAGGLTAAAAPTALADAVTPGSDQTFTTGVCPFPLQVHDASKWFKEIVVPGQTQDHYMHVSLGFTNLDTGATWNVSGDGVTHWVENADGSLTQTVDGVFAAYGPLHTVYYGHWTRTFPDGVPGPVPFTGSGKTIDICQRLS